MKKKLLVTLGGIFSFFSLPISVIAQMNDRTYDYSYGTSSTTNSLNVLFVGLYILFLCLIICVMVGICVWVYKDAKKRNVDNPGLWVLLVLFLSIPGLILYLLLGRKK